MALIKSNMDQQAISRRLSQEQGGWQNLTHEDGRSYRRAAVLIPIFNDISGWHVLFTRRSNLLQYHSGQVAFPGGAAEPQDSSPETTALREAYEEIGLQPGDVEILGRIHDYSTITNYLVTPIVGRIPWPYQFSLETNEVAHIFSIPLTWLAHSQNWEIRPLRRPDGDIHQVVYYHDYQGETLWGITARIMLDLVLLLADA